MKHVDPAHVSKPDRLPIRLLDRLLGALGASIIQTTLFGVRLWAKVTRTPYLDD